MKWVSKCIFCNHYVYRLQDNRVKCSRCNKKISLQKINKILSLIHTYINEESALHVSERMQLSYSSVQTYYEEFRSLSAKISEREYEQCRNGNCEYEEYYYLENSKKRKIDAIFDAQNFLTFDYSGHIYTLLMPSLVQYKKQFIEDNVHDAYLDEFNKFKRISRIIKVSKHYNNIVKFWSYFESSILKYKGVKNENFILYLKEFEFKYNHTHDQAIQLLADEYFKG